jgi:hypothetical protein
MGTLKHKQPEDIQDAVGRVKIADADQEYRIASGLE